MKPELVNFALLKIINSNVLKLLNLRDAMGNNINTNAEYAVDVDGGQSRSYIIPFLALLCSLVFFWAVDFNDILFRLNLFAFLC